MSLSSLIISHNTTLTAILTLALGIWAYFDKRTDQKHIAFGTMLLAVSAWTFSLVLWRNSDEYETKMFWLRMIFFVGSFIPTLFLIFSLAFRMKRRIPLPLQALIVAPQGVLFALAFFSKSLVALGRNGLPELGLGRLVFAAHFAILLVIALAVLFSVSHQPDAKDRQKLLFVLVGAIVAFNSIFGLLYGTTFTKVPDALLIANVGLVIGMFFMASAILQRSFLVELRMLGPQLFVMFLLFVIIFNIVVTETTIDPALRITMIVILACYVGLSTRTLLSQVRHARQVEVMSEQTFKLNEELMKADKMKTRFVSLASHQLRSPISGVRMYLQMMCAGDFGAVLPKQSEVLSTNVLVLNRLSETIDTFLDAAKIQLGKLELFKNETAVGPMITRVVEELRPAAFKKGLALNVEVPRKLPEVTCDEGKIMHVLANLVDNAIKYTEAGSVTVSAISHGDSVSVCVRDTGIGLTQEEKNQVADVFKRGMEAVRLDTGGSGLGLYIVKNILDAHGSSLVLESEGRGKGSSARFLLRTE